MSEIIGHFPFADHVASRLYHYGALEQELHPQDLGRLMEETLSGIVQAKNLPRDAVTGPPLGINIEGNLVRVGGLMWVRLPDVNADITMSFMLGNDFEVPGKLIVYGDPQLNIEAAGIGTGFLRNGVRDGLSKFLADPREAMSVQLATQLRQRNVQLTGLGLQVNERTLGISLAGQPLPPQYQ